MIALVTDSTCYLPRSIASKLNVKIVPLSYSIFGQIFTESYSDENGNFAELVKRYGDEAKTSQAPLSAFMSMFNELVRDGFEVLTIVMSSRLSGTYSSALAAAKAVSPDKIMVVDSLTTAYNQYLLVEKAAELIKRGDMDLLSIAHEVEAMRESVGTVFSVGSLDALRRGGRLSIVRQSVGTVLNVRPILLLKDGALVADGVARGRLGLIREMISRIPREVKRICVSHINNPEIFSAIKEQIIEIYSGVEVEEWPVGPVIGIHIGISAIGIGWLK